jgi:hypothetical protein
MDLNKMREIREKKQNNIKRTFKMILKLLQKQLEQSYLFDKTFCYFTVQSHYFGYPSFNMDDCINYITAKLQQSDANIIVERYSGGILYIDWSKCVTNNTG